MPTPTEEPTVRLVTPSEPQTTSTRPTLDDIESFYRILYYGDPGLGKSTAIASAAKLGRLVYIDADSGLKPKALRRHGIPTQNIEPYYDITWEGLETLHRELLMRLSEGEKFMLAWDTTTKTQDALLEPVVARSVARDERKGKDRTQFDIGLDDRGVVVAQMQKIMVRFHRLPCHLILGAHQRRDTDEDGRVRVNPAMSPSVITNFSGWMDCIIHMRTESFPDDETLADAEYLEFSGLTRPEGRFSAKDRFGILPKRMINPGFDRVVGYLDGEITRGKDPLQNAAIARRRNQP